MSKPVRAAVVVTMVLTSAVTACAPSSGSRSGAKASRPPAPGPTRAPGPIPFFGTGLSAEQRGSFGVDHMSIGPSGDPRFPWRLRVTYPAGSASPTVARQGAPTGGAQVYLSTRGGKADTLHLRYYVRFSPGFDFVKGGKLPGLFGGTVNNGKDIPDGTNGFSTRLMWRAKGDGEVYAYLPSSSRQGTSLGRGAWFFIPGMWTCVEQEVRLNSPGASDGVLAVWIDGQQVLRQTGIRFRTTEDLKIDGVFFSTFFGGGDRTWATPKDQYADFAAFAVSSHQIGPVRTQ